ncbi:hypothetical protein ABF86_10635 [Nitrosomonas sp. GH22]|nr:hypothetical protein [Nitrosomonas sp. GH22]
MRILIGFNLDKQEHNLIIYIKIFEIQEKYCDFSKDSLLLTLYFCFDEQDKVAAMNLLPAT